MEIIEFWELVLCSRKVSQSVKICKFQSQFSM